MANYYTYMWQDQSYKSWKGQENLNQLNVVVPNEKRPVKKACLTQGSSRSNQKFGPSQRATTAPAIHISRHSRASNAGGVGVIARRFGPQPLKHWRLQLNPDNQSGYSKMSVANFMDRPGSAINLKTTESNCTGCDICGNSLYGKLYLKDNYLGPKVPNNSGINISDISNNIFKCIACNSETNIIKSAVTLLNKDYYTNNSSYLKSRCKTYDQKLSIGNPKIYKVQDNIINFYTFYGYKIKLKYYPTSASLINDTIIFNKWFAPAIPNNPFEPSGIPTSVQGNWAQSRITSPRTAFFYYPNVFQPFDGLLRNSQTTDRPGSVGWERNFFRYFPNGLWMIIDPINENWVIPFKNFTNNPIADILQSSSTNIMNIETEIIYKNVESKTEYNMLNCCSNHCDKRQLTIYKPNNAQFNQQGAVSSSGRIAKLKYDTITKNGASFKSAYGAQAANAGKYLATSQAPYFIKNKINKCNPNIYHKNGNKNINCPRIPLQDPWPRWKFPGHKKLCC